jgi:HrpA-like RNA helicase
MSATLDITLLKNYFSNLCGTLKIGGRTYLIEDIYLDDDVINYVQAAVAKAVEIHKRKEIGDILVFLTGQEEIDSAINELRQQLGYDQYYVALSLHGNLPEEESAYIFKKIPNKRKIIFSTNVAETSVTIDGVQHVIDSGRVKTKIWDPERKMQVLKVVSITQSSVKQRRGRAGRTSDGKVSSVSSSFFPTLSKIFSF